jgi:hypothetical protein
VVSKPEEPVSPASDIPILLKIGEYFISKRDVRSVSRFGKGCKIMLVSGNELLIKMNYDKVVELVK